VTRRIFAVNSRSAQLGLIQRLVARHLGLVARYLGFRVFADDPQVSDI
jgi:hypothetical protein